LPPEQLFPIRAERCSANMTGGALLGTGGAIRFGRIAEAVIVTEDWFIAGGAAGQGIQAMVTEPRLIYLYDCASWLLASSAAWRDVLTLNAYY
jgi:hypothetical protein